MAQVEGSSSRGTVQVVEVVEKPANKEGQGWHGLRWKEDQEGRTEESVHSATIVVETTSCCDCKEWKEIKEKLRSSLGKE